MKKMHLWNLWNMESKDILIKIHLYNANQEVLMETAPGIRTTQMF